ncbi:MAG: TlyA family RNA methyltransferase [Chloroflexota bacterium]|nr:TlyA family RNA methyltransferase [Chloroflexota bacterium]
MAKQGMRLDLALVERGLVESRSRARAMILAGDVLIGGQQVTQAGMPVTALHVVELRQKPRFVSRGGDKIDHAFDTFGISVDGRVVADLGACTGGFTDAVLQRGARKVYAVDVGYGQLAFRLREDARVVVMERTNARYIESLPEPVNVVVIDVSFISLSHMFPVAAQVLTTDGVCVPLIKPQFEAGKGEVGKGGVVKDPAIHRTVLRSVIEHARAAGFRCDGLIASPLVGPAGNHEFLGAFRRSGSDDTNQADVGEMIEGALDQVRRQDSGEA